MKLCMLYSMCFFISVNKLMLASFIHSYKVYKTDFWQYFLHCFLCFGKVFRLLVPVVYCLCSHCPYHYCKMFQMCLYKCEIFILTFFVKDIYWFPYAINLFFFPEKNSRIFSLLCMFALVASTCLLGLFS